MFIIAITYMYAILLITLITIALLLLTLKNGCLLWQQFHLGPELFVAHACMRPWDPSTAISSTGAGGGVCVVENGHSRVTKKYPN